MQLHNEFRLVKNDPFYPTKREKWCVRCHMPWPCPTYKEQIESVEKAG